MALQRTFSGFPSGYPGLALLLLRLGVGGASESASMRCSSPPTMSGDASVTGRSLTGLRHGLALIIGFMTPIASVLLCWAAYFMID